MRQLFVPLLVIACVATSRPQVATADGKPVSACTYLTKELVAKVTPMDKQAFDFAMQFPPDDESVGNLGSSCEYGGIHLQIDPFADPKRLEKESLAKWTRLSGIGDVAYFRDNIGEWAELYVRSGPRVFTIQMDVPTGRTAESIKPNAIALAKELLAKLR